MKKKREEIVKKKINQLISLIRKWNHLYYSENISVVSDATYDQHMEELKLLETKFPELKLTDSPTNSVGSLSSTHLKKTIHKKYVLSLNNAFAVSDLQTFVKRINKFTLGQHSYYCEPKIDGLSITLIFKKNNLVVAATRGDGRTGEDVTKNVQITSCWQQFLPKYNWSLLPTDFEVRGEAFINKQDFLQLNQKIYFQKIKELKDKFTKNKKILFNILQKHFDSLILQTTSKIESSSSPTVLVEDNLNLFLKNEDLITNKIKSEFYLSLSAPDFLLKKVLPNLLLFFKKQKKFVCFAQSIVKNHVFLKLFCYFNLVNKSFANARNAASGSLRQLDSQITKGRSLSFIFYELISQDQDLQQTQKQNLIWLQKKGFSTSKYNQHCNSLKEVLNYVDHIARIKNQLEYEIDGVVIKINEHKFYDQIGCTSKYPNYSIAFKYPSSVAETEILDIFSTVGRTGRITYNAKLKSVLLTNTVVRAATLHNASYIQKLDIRVGDYALIKKAGDIIPKVVSVNLQKRRVNILKWVPSVKCFFCQSKLIVFPNEVDQYCLNINCEEKKIQSLIHFVSKQAMNIIGLSDQNIRSFWKKKLITNFVDVFKLKNKNQQILEWKKKDKLNNLGPKSLSKLFHAIEKTKQNSLEKLLFGLNIRHVGFKVAKVLAEKFDNMFNLIKAKFNDLTDIEGIGFVVADSVIDFFAQKSNLDLIEELDSLQVNLDLIPLQKTENSFFTSKNIVITGIFAFASRSTLINQLEQVGANVLSTVSNNVDFLLVGTTPGSKLDKAKKLNIPFLNEKAVFQILNKQ